MSEKKNTRVFLVIIGVIVVLGLVFYVGKLNKKAEYPNATIEQLTLEHEADPSDHEKLFELTLEYYKLNDYEKTEKLYGELIALKPSYTLYRKNLAKMLINQERYEEGVDEFGEVLVLNPYDAAVFQDLMNLYETVPEARELIDLDKMIDMMLEVEENSFSQPQTHGAISNLARAYLFKGDYEKAIEYYEKKIELEIGSEDSNRSEIELIKEKMNQ